MNALIDTFLPIIFLCFFNGTLVVLSGKKFGKCIPVSMVGIVLVLYISQMVFHTFNAGYVVIGIWACVFVIVLGRNKKDILFIKSNYFSSGFYAFICAAGIFFFLDFHRSFAAWDELSHWGVMSKELLRLDDWYSVSASRLLVHQDYPPFVSIFEMFWCRLSRGGGYSETGVYIANHILAAGIVVPPFADSNYGTDSSGDNANGFKSKLFKSVVYAFLLNVIFILLIKSFDADNKFMSIYKDIFLTLLFVYAMLLIAYGDAVRNKFDYVGVIFACIALFLTKQMGIAFVLIIWLYYTIRTIRNTSGRAKVQVLGKRLPALVCVPLMMFYSWKRYVKSLGISGQFELSRISVEEILEIFSDSYCTTLRRQVFNSYFHALFERDIAALFVPLSYVSGMALVLFLIWAVWKTAQKENTWKYDEAIELGVVFVCGTIGYSLVMGVLYLFCFSEGEMKELASFERYMSIWILGEILIICMLLYRAMRENGMINVKNLCIMLAACICFTRVSNLSVFIPGVLDGRPNRDSREVANYLEEKINDTGSVFILADDTIKDQYFINFYADDINIVLCYTDFLNADLQNEGIRTDAVSEVFSNDYLYIKNMNENFNHEMSYLNSDKEFKEGTLYRIIHQDQAILVKEIQ